MTSHSGIADDEERFRHNVDLLREQSRGKMLAYGPTIIGLMMGCVGSVLVVMLQQLGGLNFSNWGSTLGLTLGAVLLTITGALIVPLARSMEADDRYLQTLPNKLVLDLGILMARRDLSNEGKEQLYRLTMRTYEDQLDAKRPAVVYRMPVATSAKSVLLETLSSLLLSVVQPIFLLSSIAISFLLVSGYITAILIIAAFVFPSLTERLTMRRIRI
jgi:hypothetical protein